VFLDRSDNLRRLRQPSRSHCPAGELSHGGRDDLRAALCKAAYIFLRDGILPHARIHCRREKQRRTRCEDRRCEHIVGNPCRGLCNKVRCCRRNKHDFGQLSQRNMLDVITGLAPHRRHNGRICDRAERERRDEGCRCMRHDDMHRSTCLLQAACKLHCLIGGDAARHAEHDAPSGKRAHAQTLSLQRS
jgi:hypothetical protein